MLTMNKLHATLSLAGSLAFAMPGQAATIAITFDEPGIHSGADFTGTEISSQYHGSLGVDFIAGTNNRPIVHKNGESPFSSAITFDNTQFLFFDRDNVSPTPTINVAVSFSQLLSRFSVQYRRPAQPQNIEIDLFNGTDKNTLVFASSGLQATSTVQTFTFDSNLVGPLQGMTINKVVFKSTNKFAIDNLSATTVPVPSAALLLATALPWLARRRRA